MLAGYFGFSGEPFDDTPGAAFIETSLHVRGVYAQLLAGVLERKGLLVVLGERGSGKTALLARLADELATRVYPIRVTCRSGTSFDDLLHACAVEFGIADAGLDRMQRARAVVSRLIALRREGRSVVMLVDSAEWLGREVLTQLHLLAELGEHKLLQIVLAGLPELETTLGQPELAGLRREISVRCRLRRLTREDAEAHIDSRLRAVGCQDPATVLPPPVVERIVETANGSARRLNQLCAQTLLVTSLQGGRVATLEAAARAAQLIELDEAGRASAIREIRGERLIEFPRPAPDSEEPAPRAKAQGDDAAALAQKYRPLVAPSGKDAGAEAAQRLRTVPSSTTDPKQRSGFAAIGMLYAAAIAGAGVLLVYEWHNGALDTVLPPGWVDTASRQEPSLADTLSRIASAATPQTASAEASGTVFAGASIAEPAPDAAPAELPAESTPPAPPPPAPPANAEPSGEQVTALSAGATDEGPARKSALPPFTAGGAGFEKAEAPPPVPAETKRIEDAAAPPPIPRKKPTAQASLAQTEVAAEDAPAAQTPETAPVQKAETEQVAMASPTPEAVEQVSAEAPPPPPVTASEKKPAGEKGAAPELRESPDAQAPEQVSAALAGAMQSSDKLSAGTPAPSSREPSGPSLVKTSDASPSITKAPIPLPRGPNSAAPPPEAKPSAPSADKATASKDNRLQRRSDAPAADVSEQRAAAAEPGATTDATPPAGNAPAPEAALPETAVPAPKPPPPVADADFPAPDESTRPAPSTETKVAGTPSPKTEATAPQSAKVAALPAQVHPEIEANPTVKPLPPTAKKQETAKADTPSPAIDDMLMRRGNALLATGDVAAARLFFERAASHGSGPAAMAAGMTWDPLYLRESGVRGASGDTAKAIKWYQRAIELGAEDARSRLDRLTAQRR